MSRRGWSAGLSEPADGGAPPRAALIAGIALAVAALTAVLVLAVTRATPAPPPLLIAAVAAPRAQSTDCQTLLAQLPADLGGYRKVVSGDPAGTAGFTDHDGASVIVRCGLNRPPQFTVGAALEQVNGVQYLRVRSDPLVTYYVVDRPVYIAATLPADSGSGAVQQLSDIIVPVITAVPIDPAPPR